MPYNTAYIEAKIRKAAQKLGMSKNSEVSPANSRLPKGQYLTNQFPVLDLGVRPELDIKDFTLTLSGKVLNPQVLDYSTFMTLPAVEMTKDFHCVTSWSKYDIAWKGVSLNEIVKLAQPLEEAKYLVFKCRDGYTTNVVLDECLNNTVLFAYESEGMSIPLLHGGPVRVVIPHLYGWKSAKFVEEVVFTDKDLPGYWETRGYNNHGDPWKEERYS